MFKCTCLLVHTSMYVCMYAVRVCILFMRVRLQVCACMSCLGYVRVCLVGVDTCARLCIKSINCATLGSMRKGV